MTKGHEVALKNAEDCAEIAERELFNLKEQKSREHHGVVAAARVSEGMAAPENERSGHI